METPFKDKTVRAGMVVASRLPKADAHCVVGMIMKCMHVKRANPFPFHVFKVHYA